MDPLRCLLPIRRSVEVCVNQFGNIDQAGRINRFPSEGTNKGSGHVFPQTFRQLASNPPATTCALTGIVHTSKYRKAALLREGVIAL